MKLWKKSKPWLIGLAAIGAINWGLVGLFDFNLVSFLVGSWPAIETTVYVLVGIGGLLALGAAVE